MSPFPKRPLEFYGRLVTDDASLAAALRKQACPFLGRRCEKPRKSDPKQTIGACVVGHGGAPLIICPHRFIQRDQIFLDCVGLLMPKLQYLIVREVSMPGGSIDYFLVGMRGGEIFDYCGVEIQSLDTTGSGGIWQAREDPSRGAAAASYAYGINWKMSAKTILVQLHHKAASFEALGKKLVLVVQREFFSYVTREFDVSQLRPAQKQDPIHFHIYDPVSLNSRLQVVLTDRRSTDVGGVERMLKLGRSPDILESEVIRRIKAKMPTARPLSVRP
jgi:hypothetical protein